MRVLLLNDNSAHTNWGAQATPHAINELFAAELPGSERRWLSWDWLRSRHRRLKPPLPGRLVEGDRWRLLRPMLWRLSREVEFFPVVADDFDRFADEWVAGSGGPMAERFLREVEWCDVIVYNGENSLYRNTREGSRALFLLWLSRTRLGKPTCIINHTAHLTGVLPLMNAMVRKVYPRLDLATCREAASWRNLRQAGIDNIELVPDVVFYLREDPAATARVNSWLAGQRLEPGRYVCMSASGLRVSKPRGAWDGWYAALVRAVQRRAGLPVVLMAKDQHCQFLRDVAQRTGVVFFGAEHHFSELWPLLRQAAALVTGHFHYAIIAAIGGCPYVAMSANNHKIAGLNEMLQWEPIEPFDVTDLACCGEAVAECLAGRLANRAALSAHLVARVAALREQIEDLPRRIKALAGRRP